MKRERKLKKSGSEPQPVGKLVQLVAEWPLMTDAEAAAVQYRREEVRAAMLLLVAQLDRLDSPDPATRAATAHVIARAIPALVVKHGQILP